jgi:uncharacterized protein (DUF433 family)
MDQLALIYTAPLTYGEDGTIRIRGSRVTLDSLIHAFQQGATAEQLQASFPSVTLRDIYGTIAYYLEHQEQVEFYLREQGQAAQELRHTVESRPDVASFRAKIRTRRLQHGNA